MSAMRISGMQEPVAGFEACGYPAEDGFGSCLRLQSST